MQGNCCPRISPLKRLVEGAGTHDEARRIVEWWTSTCVPLRRCEHSAHPTEQESTRLALVMHLRQSGST